MALNPVEESVSLAVLPFANLTGDKEFKYFASGLAEELIIDLSHFSGLQMISTYTATRLEHGDDEISAARQIEIDYLVKGNLRLLKPNLHFTIQLLDTKSGKIIWAERIDEPTGDLFAIQESLVERIVFAISTEVEQNLLVAARKKNQTSLAAYDCFLRGMDKLRLGTLDADDQARTFFLQALDIDPHYSRAYAGLSLSHFNEWSCQLWELFDSSEQHAYNYAVKAYQLNDSDHIVQMILGRIYIYRRQFDIAEQHIEKSLELNSNDADNLVHLASCMVFLGRAAKGEELFKKALRLNPYRNLWYYQYGTFIYFVQKKFTISIDLAHKRQLTNVLVDLSGYIAAAYAHLGEHAKAREYIELFVREYTLSIAKNEVPTTRQILDWVNKANPYRQPEDSRTILEGLKLAGLEKALAGGNQECSITAPPKNSLLEKAIFKQENAIWRIEFGGVETTLVNLKGFQDLAKLLSAPDIDIHSTELMGTESSMDENDFLLDKKAQKAYEERIRELQEDIEEAEARNDVGRSQKAQEELDLLVDHLSKNLGIGGHSRKHKSPAERARAAVTLRIRSAIRKISDAHPSLGKHLHNSIRTGIFCKYSPEEVREWILS